MLAIDEDARISGPELFKHPLINLKWEPKTTTDKDKK